MLFICTVKKPPLPEYTHTHTQLPWVCGYSLPTLQSLEQCLVPSEFSLFIKWQIPSILNFPKSSFYLVFLALVHYHFPLDWSLFWISFAYATGSRAERQIYCFLRAKTLRLTSSISAALKDSIKRNYESSLSMALKKYYMPCGHSAVLKIF